MNAAGSMRRTFAASAPSPPQWTTRATMPGRIGDRVLRQHVGDELERARVADLEQRRAGGDDALALAEDVEHLAVDRRRDLELLGFGGARA